MRIVPQEPLALWKQFLSLGEDLLKQTNTASIMQHLCNRVSQQFACTAQLYLAEPAYPLPGESPITSIPSASAPEIVYQAYEEKSFQQITIDGAALLPVEIAIPLITQNELLAVLHLFRPQVQPFSKNEIELIQGICSYAAVAMQVNRQVTLKNWRYEQISLVRSVSAQIANVLDLDKLCARVTQLIQSSFGYYFVSIFTTEHGSNDLKYRASSTEKSNRHPPDCIDAKLGEGMIGHTALTGLERVAKDVNQDQLFKVIESLPETRAEATLPLKVEGRILGVLDIQSRRMESFHESDMLVLRSLADNIALAVEGVRLYDDLQRRADQLKAVLEINYALSSVLDLDALLEEIVQRIHDRFNYSFVHIFTVHPGRRKVIYHTGSGMRYQHLHANSFAFDLDAPRGLIPLVARTGKPFLANDVSQEPNYLPSKLPPHNTCSELTIPLMFGEDVLGVLDMQSDQTNAFDTEDLSLFEGLAAGIAVALRNATLFRSEKWRRQVADSFQDVAGLLTANTELPDLLERILSELEKTLPCDAAAIWLLNDADNEAAREHRLHLAAVHGTTQNKLMRVIEDQPSARRFLDNSLQTTSPSIRKSGNPYGPLGFACNMPETYSSISVPLQAGQKVLGTLTLAHHMEGRYGSEASAISETFANYAAVAIQNARLFSSAQEEAWSSTVLLQVTEASQNVSEEEELLSTMIRLIPLLVGIDKCAFYLADGSQNEFIMKTWYGFRPPAAEQVISETESLPFLKLRATRAPVFIDDPAVELNLETLKNPDNTNTVILLPLLSHEEVMGALLVSHSSAAETGKESRFKEHTLAILQGISQQTAVALENIRLLETRQEEAYITAVLLQVAQAVVSQNNLNDILDSIINLLPILVGIKTCAIYLWDRKEEKFFPAQTIAANHATRTWLKNHAFCSGDFLLLDEVRQTQKMSVSRLSSSPEKPEAWTKLPCLPSTHQPDLLQTSDHWLLGFPLAIKSEFYGVLLTCEDKEPSAFPVKRVELLNGVAQQISLAVQDDRLNQEMIGRERMDQEIELARQIQKTFLPERLPRIKGWHLELRWNTAREVGGDFYDIFGARDHHQYAFTIADVSDKGMPAALYMTVTRTLIHSGAQNSSSPAQVLKQVNQQLILDTQNGMFITAVFGFLDPASGVVHYANAGHNLPLIYRAGSRQIESLAKGGIALGVVDDAEYVDQSVTLQEGDVFLLYTDGVTETFSPSGEIFGEPRLTEALRKACLHTDQAILKSIETELSAYRGSEILSDDLTMVSFQRKK